MKLFYHHLVIREEITIELNKYSMDKDDREEITRLIDETIHNEILNTILTHLPKDKHQKFLEYIHKDPTNNKILDWLKEEIEDIEEKIQSTAIALKKELLAEITKSHRS